MNIIRTIADAKVALRRGEAKLKPEVYLVDELPDVPDLKLDSTAPEVFTSSGITTAEGDFNPMDYIRRDYQTLPFDNPLDLYLTFNPHLTPYKWQAETGKVLSGYLNPYENVRSIPTAQQPLYYFLTAANGSGKDSFIISPFAVWEALTRIRSRTIITSASHEQMKSQTEPYIRQLAQAINSKLGAKWFDIIQYHLMCCYTGSEIKMFVTDEPGRAEGYHPFPDYPNAEMAIIKNESKSIPDNIAEALTRDTGFNYWLEISSPDRTSGYFYDACTMAEREYPSWPELGHTYFRRVTAFECPHISREEIDRRIKKWGINHPLIQSSIYANFANVSDSVVIPEERLRSHMRNLPEKRYFGKPYAGLDFGGGGDENVLVVFHGNVLIGLEAFVLRHTEQTVEHLVNLFKKYELEDSNIIADDNGIGRGILGHLADKGYPDIRWLHAQGSAHQKSVYGNCGAEIWFKFLEVLPFLVLKQDERLLRQLANRHYEQRALGKIYLERKAEARAAGHPSPDRADALILALVGKDQGFFGSVKQSEPKKPLVFRQDELIREHRKRSYFNVTQPSVQQRYRGSVTAFLSSLWKQ